MARHCAGYIHGGATARIRSRGGQCPAAWIDVGQPGGATAVGHTYLAFGAQAGTPRRSPDSCPESWTVTWPPRAHSLEPGAGSDAAALNAAGLAQAALDHVTSRRAYGRPPIDRPSHTVSPTDSRPRDSAYDPGAAACRPSADGDGQALCDRDRATGRRRRRSVSRRPRPAIRPHAGAALPGTRNCTANPLQSMKLRTRDPDTRLREPGGGRRRQSSQISHLAAGLGWGELEIVPALVARMSLPHCRPRGTVTRRGMCLEQCTYASAIVTRTHSCGVRPGISGAGSSGHNCYISEGDSTVASPLMRKPTWSPAKSIRSMPTWDFPAGCPRSPSRHCPGIQAR